MTGDDLIVRSWLMAGRLPNGRRLQRFFSALPALVFVAVLALSPALVAPLLKEPDRNLWAYFWAGSVLALLVSLIVAYATLSTLAKRAHVTRDQLRTARASGQSVVSWRYVELVLVAALIAFAANNPPVSWGALLGR